MTCFKQRSLFTVLLLATLCNNIATASLNIPTFLLQNAAQPETRMPAVGLGTGGDLQAQSAIAHPEFWNYSVGYQASLKWFSVGGRSWDTAITYESESGIAEAILNVTNHFTSTPRSEIWITSKIGPWNPMGYNDTLAQMEIILAQFQTSYMDMLYIHWPSDNTSRSLLSTDIECQYNNVNYSPRLCRQSTWRAMELIFERGKARAIGVSNFEEKHMQDILDMNSLVPSVNQIEFHGYWHEYALVQYCQELNITVNGYAPMGDPDVMFGNWSVLLTEHPLAAEIGNRYEKSAAQVWLRWQHQQDIVVNPRTENVEHMKENLDIFDFELKEEEMLNLASVSRPYNPKVCQNPIYMP